MTWRRKESQGIGNRGIELVFPEYSGLCTRGVKPDKVLIKMAEILQTTVLNGYCWKKIIVFWLKLRYFFLQGAIDSESYSNAAACTHDRMCAYF